jgi:hypothetical protein
MKAAVEIMKQRSARPRKYLVVFFLTCIFWHLAGVSGRPQSEPESTPSAILVHATMCEKIKDYEPFNEAVAFSISTGSVSCFSYFEQIPQKMFIYHNWYRMDKLTARKKLTLNPPRWATFSSMQLREADKGPWRVDIVRPDGSILQVLRFSITD